MERIQDKKRLNGKNVKKKERKKKGWNKIMYCKK